MNEAYESNISKILAQIRTKEDEHSVRRALGIIESTLYQTYEDADARYDALDKAVPERISRVLKEAINSSHEGDTGAAKLFIRIKDMLAQLRVLKLELAFEPSEKFIERLSAWVDENAGEDLVMDISVDKNIAGGARLALNGRYREITLAELVSKALEREKETLLKMLHDQKNAD